jgi:hypothetical protein
MEKIRMRFLIQLLGMGAILLQGLEAKAAAFEILEPAGDKYMYPFVDDSPTQYKRDYASTFGAYGSIDDPRFNFDDRDGQFFLDFDTASFVQPGQGASNYQIARLSITVVYLASQNSFQYYDPSFDLLGTYSGLFSDTDLGRPIEIYGVGYRQGWSRSTFNEDSPFQSAPSSSIFDPQSDWNRKRNAFAIDFDASGQPRDVSNNVEEAFETNPWAVAYSPGYIDSEDVYWEDPLDPGEGLVEGRVLRFDLNISSPKIREYLQEGLNAGRIHLMISSLYGAVQEDSNGILKFYTKDTSPILGEALAPRLQAEVILSSAGAPPVPKVSVSRPNSSTFRVSFETQTGYQYVVQSRDSLASGNWTPKSQAYVGNGQVQAFDDSDVNPARRFYRVAVTASTP